MDEIDLPYCSRCGAQTVRASLRHRHCTSCNTDYYANPRPCNAIIITDSVGRVLLTRRALDPARGLWDLPGGFIDTGETAEESVRREAREELAVELTDIRYLCSGPDRYLYSGLNYHTLGFVYTARIVDGTTPTAHDDVSEARFFALSEIDMEALAFPVLKETLQTYRSSLTTLNSVT